MSKKRICTYNQLDKLSGYTIVEETEDSLRLLWISVHEEERGHGVGSQLIALVKEYARSKGLSAICGFVDTNPEGFVERKRFFEKHGRVFVQKGALVFDISV